MIFAPPIQLVHLGVGSFSRAHQAWITQHVEGGPGCCCAAFTGRHKTVAYAVGDLVVRGWIEPWWDEAVRHLTLLTEELTAYREDLLTRFANPRMRHLLAQIAVDGSHRIAVRILPALFAEGEEGRLLEGVTRPIADWVWHLREQPEGITDARAADVLDLADGPLDDAAPRELASLGFGIVDNAEVVDASIDPARGLGTL